MIDSDTSVNTSLLPLGKLPPAWLAQILQRLTRPDPSVRLGPGVGRDCAVLDVSGSHMSDTLYLVAKSDPITFASDEIGWYAVHVNANDVATTGATPRWFLATVLLPQTLAPLAVDAIFDQLRAACDEIDVTLVGGHTEVTYDLTRPIVMGTLLGIVPPDRLVRPDAALPGDVLVLTKRIAVEATSIIAREKAAELSGVFDPVFVQRCRDFLHTPGISVLREAQIAVEVGGVHAMHDPTEGGVATALWELAQAAHLDMTVDAATVPFYDETRQLCAHFGLNPWGVIASGSLLLAVEPAYADRAVDALKRQQIEATVIGRMLERSDQPIVLAQYPDGARPLPPFERDEITRLF
jgi:hydrogenase maturation factor